MTGDEVRGLFEAILPDEALEEIIEQSGLQERQRKLARDWHIVDSTTVALPKELMDEYPGAGDYAALKIRVDEVTHGISCLARVLVQVGRSPSAVEALEAEHAGPKSLVNGAPGGGIHAAMVT